MRQWILNFFGSLLIVTKAATEFFPGLLLSLSLVGFLHVITSPWTGEKSAYMYMSLAIYGTILRITSGLRSKFTVIGGFSECRNKLFEEDLLEGFLKLVRISKKQAKTLSSIFSITRQQKNSKTIAAYTESVLI
jgi:hypothetical protein